MVGGWGFGVLGWLYANLDHLRSVVCATATATGCNLAVLHATDD